MLVILATGSWADVRLEFASHELKASKAIAVFWGRSATSRKGFAKVSMFFGLEKALSKEDPSSIATRFGSQIRDGADRRAAKANRPLGASAGRDFLIFSPSMQVDGWSFWQIAKKMGGRSGMPHKAANP